MAWSRRQIGCLVAVTAALASCASEDVPQLPIANPPQLTAVDTAAASDGFAAEAVLQVRVLGPTAAQVAWPAVASATHYDVVVGERAPRRVHGSSLVVSTLRPDGTWPVEVHAVSADGLSLGTLSGAVATPPSWRKRGQAPWRPRTLTGPAQVDGGTTP